MKLKIYSHLIFFILILFFSGSCVQNTVPEWPEITSETKPWTRWWWMGSAVDREGLTTNMEHLQKAGIGGMELTAIYGVKGEEENFIKFLSPEWMDMLNHTLNEADRLNMGIDMANASGWPFGGEFLKKERWLIFILD